MRTMTKMSAPDLVAEDGEIPLPAPNVWDDVQDVWWQKQLIIKEADPELEKLLAEEELIEATQAANMKEQSVTMTYELLNATVKKLNEQSSASLTSAAPVAAWTPTTTWKPMPSLAGYAVDDDGNVIIPQWIRTQFLHGLMRFAGSQMCFICNKVGDDCECIEAPGCGCFVDSTDVICETCENCDGCCNCNQCSSCDGKFEYLACNDCEHCDNCGCDCSYDDEVRVYGKTQQPPWEARGIVIKHADIAALRKKESYLEMEDIDKFWGIGNQDIDPVESMASFYLLDGIAGMVFNGHRVVSRDAACKIIAKEAQAEQDKLVERLDAAFRAYCDMAIGGELRYHECVGEGKQLGVTRMGAWVDWKHIRELVGPEALLDAALLFREIERGGIGGEPWAQGAEILHARVTGKMDPRTFVDRVFTLQHNGGSFINKVSWGSRARKDRYSGEWGLDAMHRIIGPSHAANPTKFGPLLAVASSETLKLFGDWWRASNAARREWGVETTKQPSMFDDLDDRDRMQWTVTFGDVNLGQFHSFHVPRSRNPMIEWEKDAPPRPITPPKWLTSAQMAFILRVHDWARVQAISRTTYGYEHCRPNRLDIKPLLPGVERARGKWTVDMIFWCKTAWDQWSQDSDLLLPDIEPKHLWFADRHLRYHTAGPMFAAGTQKMNAIIQKNDGQNPTWALRGGHDDLAPLPWVPVAELAESWLKALDSLKQTPSSTESYLYDEPVVVPDTVSPALKAAVMADYPSYGCAEKSCSSCKQMLTSWLAENPDWEEPAPAESMNWEKYQANYASSLYATQPAITFKVTNAYTSASNPTTNSASTGW